jgi:aspartate aminotransferase
MTYLNKTIQELAPSATLAVKTRAGELRAQGKEIIDLSAGEPDIDTPEHIKEAANQAMRDGQTKYTPVPGTPACRAAIAHKLTEENNIPTEPANVIVTNGGKQALAQLFAAILDPGDEVIIPAPYWVSYVPMVELAGGKAVVVNTDPAHGYRLQPEQLQAALNDKTKVFILNSPSNPTGAGYAREDILALGKVLADSRALIVSDEVYEKICYDGFEFYSAAAVLPELQDRIVTVNALSKTYSMTGWRVGYAAGPESIIKGMSKIQGQTTSNVCSIAQAAAIAALQGPQDFLAPLIENYDRRMNSALSFIEKTSGLSVPVKPNGAFYVFVRIDQLLQNSSVELGGAAELAGRLLDEGVAVVPGEAFGDPGAFRISVSLADDVLSKGLEKINKGVQGLI